MENFVVPALALKVFIPAAVTIIMFAMGLSLRGGDFRRAIGAPTSILVALVGQYLFIPMMALALIKLFDVPSYVALGAIIVVAVPGGVVSNAFVYIGRGNVALSVSLTAISQFAGLISIPVLISYGIETFYSDVATVEFPVVKSILTVLAVNLVPMGLGMLVLRAAPRAARWLEPKLRKSSVLLLFGVLLAAVLPNFQATLGELGTAGLLALSLSTLGVLFGFLMTRVLGKDARDGFTNGIEIGIQNLPLAALIATTLLERPELAIYASVYSLVSPVVAGLAALLFNRFKSKTVSAAA